METEFEQVLVNCYKTEMVAYLKAHPECVEEAIQLAVSDKQTYSWRAAWLLYSCLEENDSRVQEHVKTIIDSLPYKDDGHQRELIKILLLMELDEEAEGILFDLCISVWEKIDKTPSVRFNALKMILKIVEKHPDLANEITFLTQGHYLETLSPGVKRSIKKMLKELAQY